jgi:hypothetical protein
MLDSHGHLAIAYLTFYTLGLPLAIYAVFKQGFGRQAGWFYLLTLTIVRIVGGAILIAEEQNPSVTLGIIAAILNSIGLAPLLLALLGLLKRVNDGVRNSPVTPNAFRIVHLATIAGLALAIAGGVQSNPTNSQDTINSGLNLRKGGAILFLLSFLAQAFIACLSLVRISHAWEGDRKIIHAAVASLPFLSIRMIYLLFVNFDSSSKLFSPYASNIYVQAFMQICMEFIVFILFVSAGLASPSLKGAANTGHIARQAQVGYKPAPKRPSDDTELGYLTARER